MLECFVTLIVSQTKQGITVVGLRPAALRASQVSQIPDAHAFTMRSH